MFSYGSNTHTKLSETDFAVSSFLVRSFELERRRKKKEIGILESKSRKEDKMNERYP